MSLPPIEIFGFQLAARDGGPGFIHNGAAYGHADLSMWEDHLVLLAHGGRGSGKTMGGAIRAALYCLTWRGALFIVTAPTMWMMHDSTWPALERALNWMGVNPGPHGYTYNRDREEVTLHPTDVTILLRSTEHPDRLRGQDAAAAWQDEPRDSPFEAFTNLTGTLRQQGYPHQLWLTTTPAGRRHWLCKVFYPNRAIYMPTERIITPPPASGRYVPYPARTRDNPFGGEDLYQFMAGTMGTNTLLARQELEGEFVLMEGLIYDQWDPDFYVKPRAEWPTQMPRRIIAGVDFGFTNPSAICVEGYDELNRRYIMRELYERQLSEHQLVSRALDIANEYHPYRWECDSEDPRWIDALRSAGLPVVRARKTKGSTRDISSGLGLCYAALGQPGVGDQHFFVDPSCGHFQNEIEGFVYDTVLVTAKRTNDPERGLLFANHLMDAWRYSEAGIVRYWPLILGPDGKPIQSVTRLRVDFGE